LTPTLLSLNIIKRVSSLIVFHLVRLQVDG
jgi:hypothetical protein